MSVVRARCHTRRFTAASTYVWDSAPNSDFKLAIMRCYPLPDELGSWGSTLSEAEEVSADLVSAEEETLCASSKTRTLAEMALINAGMLWLAFSWVFATSCGRSLRWFPEP